VADLEPFLRFWRALDATFERVETIPWGAVVTDPRFPSIWDVNYARVETADPRLTLPDVESALLPPIERSGARHVHLVVFHPEELTGILTEASSRGDKLSWDAVMELGGAPVEPPSEIRVEEVVRFDRRFWRAYRESLRHFEIAETEVVEQLVGMEREVLIPGGKRWFEVREGSRPVAFGSLVSFEGVGYVDHVVTFPKARRRGFASAITRRIVTEARAAGLGHVYLLVEPDGHAVALYERLGFVLVAQIASTLRQV
jgi:GNAT superfamily N-acetyltransferase